MNLTANAVSGFVGGQLEIQNKGKSLLLRGQIKAIRIKSSGDNAELIVELDWLAKAQGYPPVPTQWFRSELEPFTFPLFLYSVSDFGYGRICLSSIDGEVIILYPKGTTMLDRSKVVGL